MDREERKALQETFLIETEERLCEMEEFVVSLETSPEDIEILNKIFRGAHTLKGNALCLGFQGLSDFVHEIETLLQQLCNRSIKVTSHLITLLLQAIDALRQLIPDAVIGIFELQPEQSELLKQIKNGGKDPKKLEKKKEGESVSKSVLVEKRRRPWGRRREDIHDFAARKRSLRVDTEKLDRLLNLSGEITLSQGWIKELVKNNLEHQSGHLLELCFNTERLLMELQDQMIRLRMSRIGPTLHQYVRIVRDMARAHGKLVRLVIEGEDVEIDTTFIEYLKDSLTHLIRNALDHGIEPPEKRKTMGKNPCGEIMVQVFHEGSSIVLQMKDDGAGFQKESIIKKALSLGLISENEILSEKEIYRLVFKPGFSTAETVNNLSGRGIGLDVVQKNIEALRGTIDITSQEGKGSTVTIRLPLTVAIIQGFAIGVAEEIYILPLESVVECQDFLEISQNRKEGKGRGILYFRGNTVPYFSLRDLFLFEGAYPQKERIVIIQHQHNQVGLVVDDFYGEVQAVIKPLGNLLNGLRGISGSTILDNGRVGLILDVASLLHDVVKGGNIHV